MADIRNQVLEGRQLVDGNVYHDCEFKNALLVFTGVQAPGFVNTRFTNSGFVFEGQAAVTVNFLRSMLPAHTGMRGFVTGMMPEIGA